MDYDSRHVKWYWLLLFIVYCGAVVYLLFSGNPYLYSDQELRASMSRSDSLDLLTIPAQGMSGGKITAQTHFYRFDFQRSGVDPLGAPRYKDYVEYQTFPVQHGLEGFEIENIAQDSSGFYLTGASPWLVSVSLEGELRWKFKLADMKPGTKLWPALLDEDSVYAIHPSGEILGIRKSDGSLRWLTNVDKEAIAEPFIWQDHVVIPVKGKRTSEWMLIRRTDGKLNEKVPKIDVKPGFMVSKGPGKKTLILTAENKVYALDTERWKIEWSQTLTEPIKGPATVVENDILVATLGAKVLKLDVNRKGKVEWEVELEKSPAGSPTYTPMANRVTLQMLGGEIAAIDFKTGKLAWTYNSTNKSPLTDTWSVRLSGKHIEEYKMDWLHKGWTIWSACSNRNFCMFTPNKGQLIQSVAISAQPLTLPLQFDRRWIFFGRTPKGEYLISHMLENAEIKKLKTQASAETVPSGSKN